MLFSSYLRVIGVPKSIGAIYGLLFSSPDPLCFTEIVDKLGASKGSVSQGLAYLRQNGAVRPVEVKGDRREYFEPEMALRRLAVGLIHEKIQPLLVETKGAVSRMKRSAKTSHIAHNRFRLDRIRQLETWHSQFGRVLPVVQAILTVSRS